jgi:hypothetical protein
MNDVSDSVVALSDGQRDAVVERKATCPFIGSAVAQGKLAVRNSADDPLASVEEVRRLGNSGGGDLGELLVLFATGNHAFMRGDSGRLDRAVPSGLFSLEFPGSQGSHPGHSGILEADPDMPGSGRLSRSDFARLIVRANGGLLKRSEVGHYIAENLHRDPKSKVFGHNVAALLATDLADFVETTGPALLHRLFGTDGEADVAHRDLEEKLTKLLGEDSLVASAGEWGLLFTLLTNQPGRKELDGEPALSVEDVQMMFIHRRLPEGFEAWKKSRLDWVRNTTALLIVVGKAYAALNAA